MNQTEMLHQMCHEVLAETDIRAICKNRGLPNQAASSRPMLESLSYARKPPRAIYPPLGCLQAFRVSDRLRRALEGASPNRRSL